MSKGPLAGVRVVEFVGIGPAPFCGMMLSDLGADVIRIMRPGFNDYGGIDARGKKTLLLDLKRPESVEVCLGLFERADIVFEGNRPGVMERLGLGPEQALARNPALVYGRMTGWGQTGPYAAMAGHDLNYAALSGAIHAIGTAEKPIPPLNLVADYGGGAMMLVSGILAALHHAKRTGEGQVVDVSMAEGAAYLCTLMYGMLQNGMWVDQRQSNALDGGRPYYDCYQCADGKWISIAAVEPQFYAELLRLLDLEEACAGPQDDPEAWPARRAKFAETIARKTRDEWCALLEGSDTCFAPVMSFSEAPQHPQHIARQAFVETDGAVLPAPAPRFSATPSGIQYPRSPDGEGVREMLQCWDVDGEVLSILKETA